MTQPSLFNDATGTPLFSGTPIKPDQPQQQQTKAESPDNLPLFTGRPDPAPWHDQPITLTVDLRDPDTAKQLTQAHQKERN